MLSLVNPWAGGALTSSANIGIDIATGNVPDLSNPWEAAKYAGFTILDGVSAGQAGKLGRGLIGFAESGKFAWNSIYYGSNAKFTPISKELGMVAGGLDMAEVLLVSTRVKLANIAAPTIRQGANLADDAAKGGSHLAYEGLDAAGKVKYVGITGRDAAIRFGEHLNSGTARSLLDYRVIDGATDLSKTGARVWEQTLINQYGLQKNGGLLLNKMNSIAPKSWWQYGIK